MSLPYDRLTSSSQASSVSSPLWIELELRFLLSLGLSFLSLGLSFLSFLLHVALAVH